MTRPNLRAVQATPQPAPPTDYEWQDRQRILSRDWSKVHRDGDRRQPVDLHEPRRRGWR